MDEYIIFTGSKPCEYFCYRCRQLRLSPCGVPKACGFCGNTDIKIGVVGSLDKAALIRKMDGLTE